MPAGRHAGSAQSGAAAADQVTGIRVDQQETLQFAQIVIAPVLRAKCDERRKLDEDHRPDYTLAAYSMQPVLLDVA